MWACVCVCLPLKASLLVDEGLCVNIPLGSFFSGQHKHCLYNEELENHQPTRSLDTHTLAHIIPQLCSAYTTKPPPSKSPLVDKK